MNILNNLFAAGCEVHPELVQTEPNLIASQRANARRRFGQIVVLRSPNLVCIQARKFSITVPDPEGRTFFVGPLSEGSFSLVLRTFSQADRDRDAFRRITIFGDENIRNNFINHIQALGGVVKTFDAMEPVDVLIRANPDTTHVFCTMRLYHNEGGEMPVMHLETAQGDTIFVQDLPKLTLFHDDDVHPDPRHQGTFFFYSLRLRREIIQVPLEANGRHELKVMLTFIGDQDKRAAISDTLRCWGATVQRFPHRGA
jgi:hypothetical protein